MLRKVRDNVSVNRMPTMTGSSGWMIPYLNTVTRAQIEHHVLTTGYLRYVRME
jgi:hypothetical protein